MSSIVFELHAKTIVDAFHSSEPDDSEFGIAIQDCCFLCQQGFQFSICFALRQANKAAHVFVRESYVLPCPLYPTLSPNCIEEVCLANSS